MTLPLFTVGLMVFIGAALVLTARWNRQTFHNQLKILAHEKEILEWMRQHTAHHEEMARLEVPWSPPATTAEVQE